MSITPSASRESITTARVVSQVGRKFSVEARTSLLETPKGADDPGGELAIPRRVLVVLAVAGLLVVPAAGARAVLPSSKSVSWPPGQALPHFPTPTHLDVADISGMRGDVQLVFNTLEGLVNRITPRIYLLWASDEGNSTWIDTLNTEFGVPVKDVSNPWELLSTYGSDVKGMIIYDPSVPDSVNLATSLAGPEGAVVASPPLASILATAPYHLKVLADLRGQFHTRLDVYQWEYDHLWAPGRVTDRMLVGLPPFQSASVHLADVGGVNVPLEQVHDSGLLPGEPFASLRDYSVAAGAMVVWLDPNDPPERVLLEQILSGMPPDSPYLGTHPGDVAGEITIVALLSSHSVYEVAADLFNNGSVFGGVRPPITSAPVSPPAQRPDSTKIYVTFTMSDGDNIQYDQRRLRWEWDHPGRGQVPINWTISPLLLDAAPAMFDHYITTATADDLFMAGPSGAGYAYPSSWPPATFRSFTGQTAGYDTRLGIRTVDILNAPDGIRLPLPEPQAADYAQDVSPLGIMLNYNFFPECRTDNVVVDGIPVTTGCDISSSSSAQQEAEFDVAQQAARCHALGTAPCFISIEFTVWNVAPEDLVAVANTLKQQNPKYEFVRADQYFHLLRQVHNIP